ncbi:hypothetical protein BSL78_08853 [Apostichopus japonicus]|uniref:Uncharacterized protein n=1 Tax=Stichopus japonicus TaxID=307972 RepID=A0A2G8L1U6_STIJA|nr:hypothetical protein BSL78_08853 [Apostichopus japonicus]
MQEESKDYYLIASSVGSRVYAGEQVAMFCDGHYVVETGSTKPEEEVDSLNYNDVTEAPCPVRLKGSSNPVIHVPFGMNQLDVTCDLRPLQSGIERKSSPNNQDKSIQGCKEINLTLNITKALTVSLTPPTFASEDDGKLSFVCASDPPRLMYWTVMATTGNVLDFSYHR